MSAADAVVGDRGMGIYVVGSNVKGLPRLTSGLEPAFSPNGKTIAFTDAHPCGGSMIYVMNADGTGRRPFKPRPPRGG